MRGTQVALNLYVGVRRIIKRPGSCYKNVRNDTNLASTANRNVHAHRASMLLQNGLFGSCYAQGGVSKVNTLRSAIGGLPFLEVILCEKPSHMLRLKNFNSVDCIAMSFSMSTCRVLVAYRRTECLEVLTEAIGESHKVRWHGRDPLPEPWVRATANVEVAHMIPLYGSVFGTKYGLASVTVEAF